MYKFKLSLEKLRSDGSKLSCDGISNKSFTEDDVWYSIVLSYIGGLDLFGADFLLVFCALPLWMLFSSVLILHASALELKERRDRGMYRTVLPVGVSSMYSRLLLGEKKASTLDVSRFSLCNDVDTISS